MGERGDGEEGQSEVNGARLACKLQLARESLTWAPTPSERPINLPSHLSLTTRMKYCGGKGSKMGTKKFKMCSSSAYFFLRRKYS